MVNIARLLQRSSRKQVRNARGRLALPSRTAKTLLAPEHLEERCLLATYSLGNILLQGTFNQSGSTYTSTGAVQIGFAPTSTEAFNPLTTWTGTLSFSQGGTSFDFSVQSPASSRLRRPRSLRSPPRRRSTSQP